MKTEIVGARIGTIITNCPDVIAAAYDKITEFLDRPRMQFMAACDLGERWEKMATGPTLFLAETDNDGHITAVYPPEAQP